MKFLFREENVGFDNWSNRFKIVKAYFENTSNSFIERDASCGYSVADFEIMMDFLRVHNISFEVE